MSRAWVGGLGLAVGLSMALAANLTYAVPRGPVVVGIGLVCPLVLPLALLLRALYQPTWWGWALARELATAAVALPAAAISYFHTVTLVLTHDPTWPVLAWLAPLSSDGVAALATLALHAPERPRKPGNKRAQKPVAEAVKPDKVLTPTQQVEPTSDRLDHQVASWLALHRAAHGEATVIEETEAAVAKFGRVSEMTVRRARRILRERSTSTQEDAR